MIDKRVLYEAAAKKMSATDVVIYSDKTPKSLYEYYYYKYKEEDIINLINNLRMSFDSWDKSYNLYKTSPAIEEISSGDVSVLYEDHVGNLFIYSFATKKIYYYDKDNPPYVEIKYPMSVKEFLGVAKRDFEALGRTPYGKKFVTESTVLMEGIREVFGFGTALRLFIDGRKNNKANAYDKHSYAFLDAFLQFTPKKLTKDEFDRACGRDKTILEIYTNRKLGNRDENRAMPVKADALEETKVGSIITFAKEYGVDREKLYWQYDYLKQAEAQIKSGAEFLKKYLKGNSVFKASYIGGNEDYYLKCLLPIDDGYAYLWCFDLAKYKRAHVDAARNRFEKLTNADIFAKFEANIERVCDACNNLKKGEYLSFNYSFNKPESYLKNECKGKCWIVLSYVHGYDIDHYAPEIDKDVKSFNRSFVSEEFIDKFSNEEVTVEEFNAYLESLNDAATFEASVYAVCERETARNIAHKVRDGVEKAGKAVGDFARKAKDVFSPLMKKVKDTIESIQKDNEESKREEFITDSAFIKMKNLFRKCLVPIGAYYVAGPAIAVVSALGQWYFGTDDEKIRGKLVRELEVELKLTREKIEDAKGDNARKEKYELMRLESKIEDELARIKYGKKD